MKQFSRKIKRKNFFLILFVMLCAYKTSAQWITQNSNTTENLTCIQIVTPEIGYVIGDNGVFLKTLNGGESWTQMNIPLSGASSALHFINELEGMIKVDNEGIAKTIDGGDTWELMDIGQEFLGISFTLLDDEVGILTNDNKIFRTTNFGDSWDEIDITNLTDIGSSYEVEFLNNEIGWICTNQAVLKTVDGGLIWEWLFDWGHDDIIMNGSILQRVESITEDILFFATPYYLGFYATVNGGVNFEYSPMKIYDIEFLNSSVGYAIDDRNTAMFIIKTNDGGLSWIDTYEYNIANPFDLINDLHFINESIGWAVGANGLILKTENGGGTITSTGDSEIKGSMVNVFPNPAGNRINFKLKENLDIKSIRLYDNTGKEINIQYNIQQKEIITDDLNLPHQLYNLIFLLDNGNLISKRIVLYAE